jgi:hypothetical protein
VTAIAGRLSIGIADCLIAEVLLTGEVDVSQDCDMGRARAQVTDTMREGSEKS